MMQNHNHQRPRLGKLGKLPIRNTDNEWQIIQNGIQEIINHNESKLSFEELYRNAYKMVQLKDGEKLYLNIKLMIGNNLNSIVKNDLSQLIVGAQSSLEECEIFLKRLLDIWDEHLLLMGMVRDIVVNLLMRCTWIARFYHHAT